MARFFRAALPAVALLLAPAHAHAGRLLDLVRNSDLNDYALGLAWSTSQIPYDGSENSNLLYPYMTTFRHSAFTDNWLLIRDENIGFRFVVDDDWEFGLIGRVQTLGLGASTDTQTDGINDRGWSIETGPLIGWRGSPVHIQFRSYWALLNRHDGATSELELSAPLQFPRGYFVPSVKLSYLSGAYSNHYFGVSDGEATATRPVYRAGSATNVWTGFSLGYEIAPSWLLKFSMGLEHLDRAITDSPIVDRERVWSGTIGVAYNNDLFNPRDYPDGLTEGPVDIRLGLFQSAVDTKVRRNSGDGRPGDRIDLEQLIGAPDRRSVFQIDARIRLADYHRLQLAYFDLTRKSTTTLQQDISYGDRDFVAGTNIETEIDTSLLRLTYGYSLACDRQKEVGVSAGLSYFSFDSTVRAAEDQQPQRLNAEAPLPTLGAFGSVAIGDRWKLTADADFFALDFDRYDGFMTYVSVGLERQFDDSASIGLGYDLFDLRLRSADSDQAGEFDLRFHGPRLFFGLAF